MAVQTEVLYEIALEGLEGITFEALFHYLKKSEFYFEEECFKIYIWENIIKKSSQIEFYLIDKERVMNFSVQDRDNNFAPFKGIFIDFKTNYFQNYKYCPVNDKNVYGSCENYENRIQLHAIDFINLSLDELIKKYGNRFIMVAKIDIRKKALGIGGITLTKVQYAALELIGRSRFNGLKVSTLNEYLKDCKYAWYFKKTLVRFRLIQFQKLSLNENTKLIDHEILHLTRFYRPYYKYFEMSLHKAYSIAYRTIPKALPKYIMNEILKLSVDFCRGAQVQGWLDVVDTTYRKLIAPENKECKLTDTEIYKMYCHDYVNWVTDKFVDPSVIDERMICFKITKSIDEINDMIRILDAKQNEYCKSLKLDVDVYDDDDGDGDSSPNDDEEEEDDIDENDLSNVLHKKFICHNIPESLDKQVYELLHIRPMKLTEIRHCLGIPILKARLVVKWLERQNDVKKVPIKNGKAISLYYYINAPDELKPLFTSTQIQLKQESTLSIDVFDRNKNLEMLPTKFINSKASKRPNPRRFARAKIIINILKEKQILRLSDLLSCVLGQENNLGLKYSLCRKTLYHLTDQMEANGIIKTFNITLTIVNKLVTIKCISLIDFDENSEIMNDFKLALIEIFKLRLKSPEERDEIYKNNLVLTKKEVVEKNWFDNTYEPRHKKKSRFIEIKNVIQVIGDEEPNVKLVTGCSIPDLPLMLKLKLLHEYLWYISNGAQEFKEIRKNFTMNIFGFWTFNENEDVWYKYVEPFDETFPAMSMTDIICKMPIYLYCILAGIKETSEQLYEVLGDEKLKHLTIGNINIHNLTLFKYLINHRKKQHTKNIIYLIEILYNMGLWTYANTNTGIRCKFDIILRLNQKLFITDTRTITIPCNYERMWSKLPRVVYVLNTMDDLLKYWRCLYSFCRSTKTLDIYKCAPTGSLISIFNGGIIELSNDKESEECLNTLTESGIVPSELISSIVQFGCWLPKTNVKWGDLGPGGFGISPSYSYNSWYPNKYDKEVNFFPPPYQNMFKKFRVSLFHDDLKLSTPIVSSKSTINENLSLYLHELNIIATCAELLGFEMERFIEKIRKWTIYKEFFPLMKQQKEIAGIMLMVELLTAEHIKVRKDLIKTVHNNSYFKELFKNISEIPRKSDFYTYQKIIYLIFQILTEVQVIIPQFNIVEPTCQFYKSLPKNILENDKFENNKNSDDKTEISNIILKRSLIRFDIDSGCINDESGLILRILELTVAQFLFGSMKIYSEHNRTNNNERNAILKHYSFSLCVQVINKLQNFKVFKLFRNYIINDKYESISARLRKFSHAIRSNINFIDISIPKFYNLNLYIEMKDYLVGLPYNTKKLLAITDDNNNMKCESEHCHINLNDVSLSTAKIALEILLLKCLYNDDFDVNVQNLKLTEINTFLKKVCKDQKATSCYTSLNRNGLKGINLMGQFADSNIEFKPFNFELLKNPKTHNLLGNSIKSSLDYFNKHIPIPLNQNGEPLMKKQKVSNDENLNKKITKKRKASSTKHNDERSSSSIDLNCVRNCQITLDDRDVLLYKYIVDGKYYGRKYFELLSLFDEDVAGLRRSIHNLIHQSSIYVVGMNEFHFVADKYTRPWVIKIPNEEELTEMCSDDKSDAYEISNRTKKRKLQEIEYPKVQTEDRIGYIPIFFRNEMGQFKYFTFQKMVNVIYGTMCKYSHMPLESLIKKWAGYFGENSIRFIVDMLYEAKVFDLKAIIIIQECDLFTELEYDIVEPDLFDSRQIITITLSLLHNFKKNMFLKEVADYFQVNLEEPLSDENEIIEDNDIKMEDA